MKQHSLQVGYVIGIFLLLVVLGFGSYPFGDVRYVMLYLAGTLGIGLLGVYVLAAAGSFIKISTFSAICWRGGWCFFQTSGYLRQDSAARTDFPCGGSSIIGKRRCDGAWVFACDQCAGVLLPAEADTAGVRTRDRPL
ncbi:hypothetical protein [Alkalicoccus urumqiensis]|uniref:Uncharacterized protein n=1 Tax=Alkalicoccus urumqiensis TaxID=1548213 RepID=A0A2P6MJM0_ALKUR|nr:hypothetical protein [Alkalicoccus urumqiensis]PRO66479.1 hypothetical protein C6I21_03825 [Alkalicoccus urumqiensis]